jgi:hypothetical protein
VLREQLTGAGNRLAIRVQLTLRRAEVSVAGDLPEYMHGHARVIHFRCKLSNTTRYTDNGSVSNLASSQRRVWSAQTSAASRSHHLICAIGGLGGARGIR